MKKNPSLELKENWIENVETALFLTNQDGWKQWVCK